VAYSPSVAQSSSGRVYVAPYYSSYIGHLETSIGCPVINNTTLSSIPYALKEETILLQAINMLPNQREKI